MSLRAILRAWDDFWFAPASPIPIALFRILVGLCAFVCGISIVPDLHMWFGEKGIVSLKTSLGASPPPYLDLFAVLPPGDGWVAVFLATFIIASIFLTVGLFSKWSALWVYVGLLSFHHRNPIILDGGEGLLLVFTFFLIFSQAGRALSFDQLWRSRRDRETTISDCAPWAQRLIQIYLVMVYISCFCSKAISAQWVEGMAVYYAVRFETAWRFRIPYLFEHMRSLKLLSWGTLLFEFSFPLLVWIRELRYVMLALGLLFHLGLNYSLNIFLFQWVTLSAYVTFIDAEHLERVAAVIRGGRKRVS